MWEGQGKPDVFSILDIGCNEGNLSMGVLEEAKRQLPDSVRCTLLGVDIDSSLIDLACAKFVKDSNDYSVAYKTLNFMDTNASNEYMNEYWQKLSAQMGCTLNGFCVVCLFSITMWIHLNHGDEGLLDCLQRSAALLNPTGSLVVEPQPWKCYKSADKRCRKLGITRPLHYSALLIRDIEVEMVRIVMGASTHGGADSTALSTAPASKAAEQSGNGAKASASSAATGATFATGGKRDISGEMGMGSYWDLGKEGWGRSILIFHRSPALATKVYESAAAVAVSAESGPGDTSSSEANDGNTGRPGGDCPGGKKAKVGEPCE
jgi:hypothetical protein